MGNELRRELGFWDAVATGISAMIGAGIFVVSGIGAKIAGSSVIVAFVVAGFVALLNALSSAELAAAIPREGGTYEYARRLISPRVGFLTGWLFVSSKMLEAATVALAFGSYVAVALNIEARIIAIAAVLVLTLINVVGIRATTNVSIVMAVIKLIVLTGFAVLGVASVELSHFEPFAPNGVQGLLSASALIFFAYTGYARIATLGEEVKEPQVTIPRAIILSLAVTTVVYIAVTTIGIGLAGVEVFSTSDSPIAAAASTLNIPGLVAAVVFGAGVATLSVLLSDLISSSRTVFAMARNGDLPDFLSQLRNYDPVNSTLATSAIVLTLVIVGNLVQIATFTSLTILIYYAVTNLSSLKLLAEKRLFPRAVSVAGFAACLVLTVFLPLEEWLWTIILLALGFAYSMLWRKK